MRYVLGIAAVVMLFFVVVQYNDPDGPLWMVYYGVPAVFAGLAAFRPRVFAGQVARLLLILALIAAVALTIVYWPPVSGWWHEDTWRMSGAVMGDAIAEQIREAMGMMIITAVLALTAAAVFGGRRRIAGALR